MAIRHTKLTRRRATEQEYLAFDNDSATRHEMIDGQIYAMTGGSPEHSEVCGGALAALFLHVPKQSKVYSSDLKIRTAVGDFFFPDASAVCDPEYLRGALLNPVVIVEVLSPSTAAFDRGAKFISCQSLISLQAYVLLSQNRLRAELFARAADGTGPTEPQVYEAWGDSVPITALDCALPLATVYARVAFEQDGDAG
jgi:Uma2 family endonuclease